MKLHTLPGIIAILAAVALCCAGCIQELDLADKYINEAAGFLRVQNTSTDKSYVITAVELRDASGNVIKAWEGLALEIGETWTGDLDTVGSFTLYCTVQNTVEGTAGTFNHGPVEIKLHEVADSGITGEVYLSTADTDGDGFSDFWETHHDGFNPEDPSDGGTVYVSTTVNDEKQLGTANYPYFTLAAGVEKAMYGLSGDARTVVVIGTLTRNTEGARGTETAVFSITDTGLHGVTITGGELSPAILNAAGVPGDTSGKRVLHLGPGAKITLENIKIINGAAYRGAGIHADGADLTLGKGVVIQNGRTQSGAASGGGVYASGGATVVMKSGSLIGDDDVSTNGSEYDKSNTGWMGVGVALLDGSSLTMENGSRITGNLFTAGGAVSADLGSWITLEPGAEITSNSNEFVLTTYDANHGGGVRLTKGSKLIMKGGLISGNIITKGNGGGGVYVGSESVFEMRDGEIRGTSVGTSSVSGAELKGNGGGVYVDSGGIFRMSGGTIAGNTATGMGGGVYVNGGNFFKSGGAVYGSDASGNNSNTAAAADEGQTTGNGHAFFGTPSNPADKNLPDSFTF
jgi:hypothetical protein